MAFVNEAMIEQTISARKVTSFNTKIRVGQAVLVIFSPGTNPVWDRTTGPARIDNGRPVVNVASRIGPVHTDTVYTVPAEIPVERCLEPRLPFWRIVMLLALVFSMAYALMLAMPTHAGQGHPTETLCIEPDDVPDEGTDDGSRRQSSGDGLPTRRGVWI